MELYDNPKERTERTLALFNALGRDKHDEPIARILMGRDIDWNMTSKNEHTLLYHAILYRSADISLVKDIIKAAPQLVNRACLDLTPLMLSAIQNRTSVLSVLIDAAANLDQHTSEDHFNHPKWAALHFACHFGQLPAVRQLAQAGADITLKTRDGKTCMDISYERVNQVNIKNHDALLKEHTEIRSILEQEQENRITRLVDEQLTLREGAVIIQPITARRRPGR